MITIYIFRISYSKDCYTRKHILGNDTEYNSIIGKRFNRVIDIVYCMNKGLTGHKCAIIRY